MCRIILQPITRADTTVFEEDGINLSVSSDSSAAAGVSYQWQPSFLLVDPISASTSSNDQLKDSTLFIVEVITQNGCIGRDSVKIVVNRGFILPTVITPNNDGFNDTWELKNLRNEFISSHKVSIFDNFGCGNTFDK